MGEVGKGVWAMVAACAIWGLSPLFYALLYHVPPVEVLAHRTVWSLVTFGAVLAVQRRLRDLPRALDTPRKAGLVAAAAAMISVNWLLFIFAVGAGRTVEASLGYYIYPLVAVAIGALVLGEAMRPLQWMAVALAALAVVVLTWGLGAAPWISLVLAATFGVYGLIKRFVAAGPVVSVSAEVLVGLPLALGYIGWLYLSGASALSLSDWALLIASGPMTATPLILFSHAARRVAMATVGLIQYLNPSLQFIVAVTLLAETVTPWHAVALPIIWVALALYSWVSLRTAR